MPAAPQQKSKVLTPQNRVHVHSFCPRSCEIGFHGGPLRLSRCKVRSGQQVALPPQKQPAAEFPDPQTRGLSRGGSLLTRTPLALPQGRIRWASHHLGRDAPPPPCSPELRPLEGVTAGSRNAGLLNSGAWFETETYPLPGDIQGPGVPCGGKS